MNRRYVKIALLFIYCSLISTIVISQDLSLNLSISNKELSNIEFLNYKLELQNNGDSVSAKMPLNFYLEYYDEDASDWVYLEHSALDNHTRFGVIMPICFQPKNRVIIIKAKEKIIKTYQYSFLKGRKYSSKDYLFDKNTSLRLRGVFRLKNTKDNLIYSNEEEIIFTNYTGENRLALHYLKKLSIPHFVYAPTGVWSAIYSTTDEERFKEIEHAKYLIENYPNSKFICWAYLYLAWEELNYIENNLIAFYNDKNALNQAEIYVNKAIEFKDKHSIKNIKEIYGSIAYWKFHLMLNSYGAVIEYEKDLDYIDNL